MAQNHFHHAVSLLLITVILASVTGCRNDSTPVQYHLLRSRGTVRVKSGDQEPASVPNAQLPLALTDGAVVDTAADSWADLVLVQGALIRVEPNSSFTVALLARRGDAPELYFAGHLAKGRILVAVRPAAGSHPFA